MSLRLYNTFTKKEEEFTPMNPPKVTMYTCGPTVYGRPHVGNYASFLMADLLRRWLEVGHGYKVEHVKNITDVGHLLHDSDSGDDKVQKEAEKQKVHPLDVAKKYEEMFLQDEQDLGFLEPKNRPRASEYVKEMLSIIKTLLEKGNAYETEDGIYFAVTSFPSYGKLSGNILDNMSAGARVEVDEKKKHPADFALWKKCVGDNAKHILRWSYKTGDRSNSEGEDASSGFPGWHIECSAMSSALLGKTLDIHTGGEDNIFPHHECEIAQSECAFGVAPFARLWIHRRRIQMGDEKMSKSLGNVLDLPSIVEKGYKPQDLRYFLLSVHYRTNLKFSWDGLDDAKKARMKMVEWMDEMSAPVPGREEKDMNDELRQLIESFSQAMDSDLNVSAALASVFEIMSYTRTHEMGETESKLVISFIEMVQKTFGCFEPEGEGALPPEVEALRLQRDKARQNKDFAESDRLRQEIEGRGFVVKDTKEGQQIRRK